MDARAGRSAFSFPSATYGRRLSVTIRAGPIVTPAKPHVYTGATNPQILGHEFSARVKKVGAAVSHARPGDRISIQPLMFPRDDYYGKRGLYHLSPKMACVGLSWAWGGMAEQATIKDYNAQPIPDNLTDEQGAMIEPAAVAMYGVDRGGVTAGSTVLVSGAGPIGALTILAAKAAGASLIIVSEPNPNRRRIVNEIAPYAVVALCHVVQSSRQRGNATRRSCMRGCRTAPLIHGCGAKRLQGFA